jgi:hypothetical protein
MKENSMAIVQLIIISITCVIFIGRLFFGFFKRFSPLKQDYKNHTNENSANSASTTNPPDFKRQGSILNRKTQMLKNKFFPTISHESTVADDELISVCI